MVRVGMRRTQTGRPEDTPQCSAVAPEDTDLELSRGENGREELTQLTHAGLPVTPSSRRTGLSYSTARARSTASRPGPRGDLIRSSRRDRCRTPRRAALVLEVCRTCRLGSRGVSLLLLARFTIVMCSAEATQTRAAAEDPGRTAVYALVLLTSGSSLLATTALVHRARLLPGSEGGALVGLSLANVALCWALTHTAFTLRYAHLYYRRDEEGVGGVEFPGGAQPSYFDFAYLV